MIAWFARSRKAITALVVGVIGWVQLAVIPDNHVTPTEWLGLAILIASALGVYTVTNEPSAGADLASSAAADGYIVEPLVDRTGTPGSSYTAAFNPDATPGPITAAPTPTQAPPSGI